MLTRPLTRDELPIPVIGQGTWKFDLANPGQVRRSLLAGIDAGMTHIDTAETYGPGKVEELLGATLGRRRKDVFLASKVLPFNASYEGTLRACEDSLRRLRTDHIDLYMLHWPGRYSLERTIAAFRKLIEQGKIRYFGVSNFDDQHLRRLDRLTEPGEVACNQVWYSLRKRAAVDQRVAEQCRKRGIAVVGYSPLESDGLAKAHSGYAVLDRIAQAHGATRQQVVLAFLIRQAAQFVIPRSVNPAHTLENAAAADLRLSYPEQNEIDSAFPASRAPKRLPVTTGPNC